MQLADTPIHGTVLRLPKVRRSVPLAVRWTFSIAALIALVMVVLGWVLIEKQRASYYEQTALLGQVIADQLADAASEPLMAGDKFALKLLLSRLRDHRLIRGMQVVDYENGVLADEGEVDAPGQSSSDGRYFSAKIRYQGVPAGEARIFVDTSAQKAHLRELVGVLIWTTLGLIAVGALLAFPLARRLSRPITQLAEAGEALRRGDPVVLDGPRRNDELGAVAKRFLELAEGMARKEQAENALSRYVSADVAEDILSGRMDRRPGGEMIEGSVLFCDIVGFTALSESLPPEEVSALLNDYFRHFTLASASCGGMVDKFIGDCIVIVFGVPRQDPDHALHAVICAVLIQTLAEQLSRRREAAGLPTVCFRIGINSGSMLAGNLGYEERMQFTVIGDTVNVASRLCDLASPGGIMITGETASHPQVCRLASPTERSPVKVKGRNTSVRPFQIDAGAIGEEARIQEHLRNIFGTS